MVRQLFHPVSRCFFPHVLQVESVEKMSWNASVTVAAAICVGTLVANSEEICNVFMVRDFVFAVSFS
jgi:hypothetical protein